MQGEIKKHRKQSGAHGKQNNSANTCNKEFKFVTKHEKFKEQCH